MSENEKVLAELATKNRAAIMRLHKYPTNRADVNEQLQKGAERIMDLERENAELRAEIERKQSRIDSLMLEFCPDEMTPEQK